VGLADDMVVVVTGGGGGIGRAAACLFSAEGAAGVVVGDTDTEQGKATVELIESAGGAASFCQVDVTSEEQVAAMVEQAVRQYGRLDCAFNNAGVSGQHVSFDKMPLEEMDRILRVDLVGVFLCMKHEISQMKRQASGAIVNTSSIAGFIGAPTAGPYTAAKHGVIGLTKAAALDVAAHGLRVNAVCPGRIDTAMLRISAARRLPSEAAATDEPVERLIQQIPLGRLGRPEDIAESVVWLCSARAAYITGESLVVDGGLCVPRSR
jgi:NAD(P)-dependent dehydrogenase (short-subunit alcohol dehydrogenase family)